MELSEIINKVKEACISAEIRPGQDTILDCSVRIFNTNRMNNLSEPSNDKQSNDKSNDKPTEKQIATLIKFKIKVKEELTKQEATKLISDRIKKLNNSH